MIQHQYRRSYNRKAAGFWYVDAIDTTDNVKAYMGHVIKGTDGKWGHSKDNGERYATRKAATEALMTFAPAEIAAVRHFANATSEDRERAHYLSATYQASQAALFAAITDTYPDVPAGDVYDAWVDCGESINYCVNHLRRERVERERAERDALASDAATGTVVNVSNDGRDVTLVAYGAGVASDAAVFETRDGEPLALSFQAYDNADSGMKMAVTLNQGIVAHARDNGFYHANVFLPAVRPSQMAEWQSLMRVLRTGYGWHVINPPQGA